MPDPIRIEKSVYGGDGLARTPAGEILLLPFTLHGELVEKPEDTGAIHILQPSPDRVQPQCIHFGACGGCQYQMASYPEQLRLKAAILHETLERAGAPALPELQVHPSPDPWHYRNRIRLRTRWSGNQLQLGYSIRGTHHFLPITMCPIATPLLWQAAEVTLQTATTDRTVEASLRAAAEIEFLCNEDGTQLAIHLLCPAPTPNLNQHLQKLFQLIKKAPLTLRSIAASRLHPTSGRPLEQLASAGSGGLAYRVNDQIFWLRPGSFFQVNRLLIPTLVNLVCATHTGSLAWDLYAGVGLFARHLALRFAAITAVEANPIAVEELRRGLKRSTDTAIQQTTLGFLRQAVLQRERPDLIVLDPPRAGAEAEVCQLLLRLSPAKIVYISCDPTTLARDLAILSTGYRIAHLHMLDLFPQTYHLETVMVLHRTSMEP